MARRSTLGSHNPLDRLGDGPLDFIKPEPSSSPAASETVVNAEQMSEPLKMLGVRIPATLHRRIKERAAAEGKTLQELAVQVYESYLNTES